MSRPLVLGVLMCANIFVWTIPVPHGLAVSFLDVGHGRAALVRGPSGSAVLIDGGPDSSVLRGIGSALPFFVRSLDAVIETNPDAANIGGLPDVFRRYRVKAFIQPAISASTKAAQALDDEAGAADAARVIAARGVRLALGRGAYADILFPDGSAAGNDSHANSVAVRIVYGRTSFLLPSDATQKVQARLLSLGGLESDVLAVPHYGSEGALSQDFLDAAAPQYAVLSYGCDNRWGYPAPEVVRSLENAGAEQASTCEDGTVSFVSDGRTVRKE